MLQNGGTSINTANTGKILAPFASVLHIALFLEYIPHNLYEGLPTQIAKDDDTAERAVTFVDEQLKATNSYMKMHGLMHFDAHFKNILTDGERLYLIDFGLA